MRAGEGRTSSKTIALLLYTEDDRELMEQAWELAAAHQTNFQRIPRVFTVVQRPRVS